MAKFDTTTEPHHESEKSESSQFKSYEQANSTVKNKCNWEDEKVIKLLNYLIENKDNVHLLQSRGSTANKVKETLWNGARLLLNNQYEAKQIAIKWKNIKKNYKVRFTFFNKKI